MTWRDEGPGILHASASMIPTLHYFLAQDGMHKLICGCVQGCNLLFRCTNENMIGTLYRV